MAISLFVKLNVFSTKQITIPCSYVPNTEKCFISFGSDADRGEKNRNVPKTGDF